jgi:hypothetical protein
MSQSEAGPSHRELLWQPAAQAVAARPDPFFFYPESLARSAMRSGRLSEARASAEAAGDRGETAMAALAKLILIVAFFLAFGAFVVARYVKTHATPGIKAARVLSEALHRQTLEDWRDEMRRTRSHLKHLARRR